MLYRVAWFTVLWLFGLPPVLVQAATNRFEPDILKFEAADRTNPPPQHAILFIGGSSIRLWKTLAQDFPKHPVINRGFGGSQIGDSIEFAPRIAIPYQPRQIVMFAGGNDLNAGKSPETVLADFKAFVETIRVRLPGTRITYISITPTPARWAQVEKIKSLNRLIQEYCRSGSNLDFIDAFSLFLNEAGQPRSELFVEDRLHLNAQGYAIWTRLLMPHLK